MKRRKFLAVAGMGGLVAAVLSFRFVATSTEDAVVNRIIKELNFLKLNRDGVVKFVADYTATMGKKAKLMLKSYSFMGMNASNSQKINTLLNAYMLSTDFFINGMDESKEVKYIGMYDPYNRPCAHPFSNAYYPEAASHSGA